MRGDKPVLKCFINELEFYKSNFETRFFQLVCFMRNWYEAYMSVFGLVFET